MCYNSQSRTHCWSAARELLQKLKEGLLGLDWRKYQRSQAQVRVAIADLLDALLPAAFNTELYEEKCELVYRHVYENYYGQGRGTYEGLPLGV